MLNEGDSINFCEPLRDFNGFSWNIVAKDIQNITYNLIYQDLILIKENIFFDEWINHNNYVIDYFEKLKEDQNYIDSYKYFAETYVEFFLNYELLEENNTKGPIPNDNTNSEQNIDTPNPELNNINNNVTPNQESNSYEKRPYISR